MSASVVREAESRSPPRRAARDRQAVPGRAVACGRRIINTESRAVIAFQDARNASLDAVSPPAAAVARVPAPGTPPPRQARGSGQEDRRARRPPTLERRVRSRRLGEREGLLHLDLHGSGADHKRQWGSILV